MMFCHDAAREPMDRNVNGLWISMKFCVGVGGSILHRRINAVQSTDPAVA